MTWHRYRFTTHEPDWRPVTFPPPGPFWCTGYGEDGKGEFAVIVAYLPPLALLRDYWPEVADVDCDRRAAIEFTSRFPCPDWWQK